MFSCPVLPMYSVQGRVGTHHRRRYSVAMFRYLRCFLSVICIQMTGTSRPLPIAIKSTVRESGIWLHDKETGVRRNDRQFLALVIHLNFRCPRIVTKGFDSTRTKVDPSLILFSTLFRSSPKSLSRLTKSTCASRPLFLSSPLASLLLRQPPQRLLAHLELQLAPRKSMGHWTFLELPHRSCTNSPVALLKLAWAPQHQSSKLARQTTGSACAMLKMQS